MKDDDRVVLVTGGTRGIGFETAKRFLKSGCRVAVASIDDEQTVNEAVKKLGEIGEALYFPLDVAKEESCEYVVEKTIAEFGQIDVLANIAGIVGEIKTPLEADMKDVANTIQVNLMGTIYMSVYAAKHMKERHKGVIINTSSICGFMATNVSVGYHASKGGINMVTKVFAKEFGPYGIRCCAIAPGTVRTRLMDPSIEEDASKLHMKGRVEEPTEIAGAIYLLASDEASAINGTTVMTEDGFCSFKGIW